MTREARLLVGLVVTSALFVSLSPAGAREAGSQRPKEGEGVGLRWRSRLAVGPSDVRALAVRDNVVIAGGRSHFKTETYPEVREVPRKSPRVGGIFRSIDEGETWRRAVVATKRGVPTSKVIARAPDLLAFASPRGAAYAVFGDELWRSDDDGISWRQVGDAPAGARTITVLRDGRVVLGGARGGLLASADDGRRWKPYGTGLPKSDGEASAAVNDVDVSGDVVLVATDAGLYRKALNEKRFERAMTGMAEEDDADPRATAIAAHENVFYATTGRKDPIVGSFPQVYASVDGGATWSSVGALAPRDTATAEVIPGGLVVGIRDGLPHLFATTDHGFVRAVGGTTSAPLEWRRIVRPFGEPFSSVQSPPYAAIAVERAAGESGDDNVYFGIQRASLGIAGPAGNRLATPGWFDEMNGGRICGGLHVHHTSGDLVVACGRHVFRSSDHGSTWRDVSAGLPWGMGPPETDGEAHTSIISDRPLMRIAQTADGSTWTTMWNQGLFRSDADLTKWQKVPFPGTSTDVLEPDPEDPDTLYAAGGTYGSGSYAVWRTRDAGATWEPVFATRGRIMTIDVADRDPQRIMVTTHQDGIYVSHDGGITFMPASGIGSSIVPDQLVQGGYSPADRKADVAWALSWDDDSSGLYRSDDGGLTWSAAGRLPMHPSVGALYLSPWDKDTFYAQDSGRGTIVSRDGGETHCYLNRGVYAHEYVVGKVDGYTITGWSTYSSLLAFGERKGKLYIANGHLGVAEHRPSQWVLEGFDDPSVCDKHPIPPKS